MNLWNLAVRNHPLPLKMMAAKTFREAQKFPGIMSKNKHIEVELIVMKV